MTNREKILRKLDIIDLIDEQIEELQDLRLKIFEEIENLSTNSLLTRTLQ